jgi:proteasome lid subunit RPN8/RPN11
MDNYYLGEWHYHPRGSAEPSEIDIAQMINISKSHSWQCPEPLLIIIAKNNEFNDFTYRSFVFPRNNKLIELYQ